MINFVLSWVEHEKRFITSRPWDIVFTTQNELSTYPVNIFFVLKMLSAFTSAAYIQVHFRIDFVMEVNTLYVPCSEGLLSCQPRVTAM